MARLYALQADAWMGLAGQAMGAEEQRRVTVLVRRADVCVARALERKSHGGRSQLLRPPPLPHCLTASLSNIRWPLDRSPHPHVYATRARDEAQWLTRLEPQATNASMTWTVGATCC